MDLANSRTTTAGLLDFRRLQHGTLSMDGDFDPGVYVLLGDELAPLSQLLELTLGHSPPQRGEVRVAGAEPWRDPAIRRRIGSLLWQEELPEAKSVLASVQLLLELHGEKGELVADALRQLGLQDLTQRHPHALNSDERRGVALAVALSLQQPLLLALAAPLSVRCVDRHATLTQLRAQRKQAVVLIATMDPTEAARIDGLCLLFSAGRIVRRVAHPGAQPGTMASLSVTSADSARLARLLAGEPAVVRLEAPLEGETVVVHGRDLCSLSRTLLRLAHEQDIDLLSLSQRVPSPHELWNQPRSARITPVAPGPTSPASNASSLPNTASGSAARSTTTASDDGPSKPLETPGPGPSTQDSND